MCETITEYLPKKKKNLPLIIQVEPIDMWLSQSRERLMRHPHGVGGSNEGWNRLSRTEDKSQKVYRRF